MKPHCKRIFIWAGLGLGVIAALAAALCAPRTEYGHLRVNVLNAMTLAPVAGARIVLPQCGLEAVADSRGRAQLFGVPVEKNAGLEGALAQPFGQTTLLAYCDGYVPYALFFVRVSPGPVRGLNIYLFPDDGSLPGATTVIEAPPEDWVEELVKKYDPFSAP